MNVNNIRDEISMFYGNPLATISNCLRGFIIAAPGHDLIACDFNAIESRVVNWLAGEEAVLQTFRDGEDIYLKNAAVIFNCKVSEVTKDQRQIGKVAELSLGFQGGKMAFQMMAKNYGVKVPEKQAEAIKVAFRESRPKLVTYWQSLENASLSALENPGRTCSAGPYERRIKFRVQGSFLWCQLPSKRVLCYPYPQLTPTKTPWGEMRDQLTYMGEDSLSHKFERTSAYGGKLCENVTQAVARDLLVYSMINLDKRGYKIVMHVHDEVVAEMVQGAGSVGEMESIMEQLPDWAHGLPIKASGWKNRRYQK